MTYVSQNDRVKYRAIITRLRLGGLPLHEAEKMAVELMEKMQIVDRLQKRIEYIMARIRPSKQD